jgi:hypothetical protein
VESAFFERVLEIKSVFWMVFCGEVVVIAWWVVVFWMAVFVFQENVTL